ncbi:MAG: xanthine dehydrogenase family protein subunit M [Caldilineae bacterium]|nr:MAG: xanthine dehydrogenase family protein subunit M [Caldilineae bacterium]
MRPFDYYEATSLEEAVSLLGRYDGRASILAGGTDLLVEMKEGLRAPACLVNIKRIPGLDELSYTPGEGLRIGAAVTVRQVERHPAVRQHYAGLAQAACQLGSVQVRNRATVVGNICRASPSADTAPPLIADGALVCLFGADGTRTVPLEEFFTGPGQTVLRAHEIVTELRLPDPIPHTGQVYLKHGRRLAMELATVGVAVSLTLQDEICTRVRIVLGAVAPTPIRASEAEAVLEGRSPDSTLVSMAAVKAQEASRPIDDVRSSAAYRRQMVRVLTLRALEQALTRARQEDSP